MPRQRTPLAQAEATGAIDKNKKRFEKRLKAPKYGGTLGPAPMYFSPERVLLWDELVSKIPENVLASADCYIVELAVVLLEKFRNTGKPGVRDEENDTYTPPPQPITGVEIGHLRACLGSLGMTPADRTRVNPTGDDEKARDPLDVILGSKGFGKAN